MLQSGSATGSGGASGDGGSTGKGGTSGSGGASARAVPRLGRHDAERRQHVGWRFDGRGWLRRTPVRQAPATSTRPPARRAAAAYSMIRALSKAYTGPLYQVRNGSSTMNTGSGGMTKDIGMTADGFADTATQDAFCSGTTCTFSLLYDQSGNGNDLKRAPAGLTQRRDLRGHGRLRVERDQGHR